MTAVANTIVLKGDGLYKEGVAGGAITPGHLVQRNSSDQIVVHPTAAGNVPVVSFAVENDFFGLTIDDAYASTKKVFFVQPQRGSEINALVAANASAIVIGDLLESAGDGTVRKYTAPSQAVAESGSASYTIAPKVAAIVGVALVALDNSAVGTPARIRMEVI